MPARRTSIQFVLALIFLSLVPATWAAAAGSDSLKLNWSPLKKGADVQKCPIPGAAPSLKLLGQGLGPLAHLPQVVDEFDYSHTEEWPSLHAYYYMKYSKQIVGTDQDCAQCHEEQGAWMPLNINCTTACHTPTTSEARDAAGIPGPKAVKVTNKCTGCHSNVMPGGTTFTHFPADAGLCVSCHEAAPDHLSGKNSKAVTTKSSNDSCYQCHAKKDTETHVHPALLIGDPSCTNCHDPHGSQQRYYITGQKIADSCAKCHQPPTGKSVHGVASFGKGCVGCHEPHSTPKANLLIKESEELCFTCHNKEIVTQGPKPRTIPNIYEKMKVMPQQHTGTMGGCESCHNAHASSFDRLLSANYSLGAYNLFDADPKNNPYSVCFSCHDVGMFAEKNLSTQFRNDDKSSGKLVQKNLHWYHVVNAAGNADKHKGRSCRVCHDPHGAPHAFNISESFKLGTSNTPIPVGFQQNGDGGQCMNMCHNRKTLSYKRLSK